MILGLIIFVVFYLTIASLNYIHLLCRKDMWTDEVKEGWTCFRFRFLFFIYGPIAITKKIFGEINE